MNRSSLETATGLGKTRLIEVLNSLVENGKIERKGKSRGVIYGLKEEEKKATAFSTAERTQKKKRTQFGAS
jgi:hypothetical protein